MDAGVIALPVVLILVLPPATLSDTRSVVVEGSWARG